VANAGAPFGPLAQNKDIRLRPERPHQRILRWGADIMNSGLRPSDMRGFLTVVHVGILLPHGQIRFKGLRQRPGAL
jgi:hypothetical protein